MASKGGSSSGGKGGSSSGGKGGSSSGGKEQITHVVITIIRVHNIRYTRTEIRSFTWDELMQVVSLINNGGKGANGEQHNIHEEVVQWVKDECTIRENEKKSGKTGRFWSPCLYDPPRTAFPVPKYYALKTSEIQTQSGGGSEAPRYRPRQAAKDPLKRLSLEIEYDDLIPSSKAKKSKSQAGHENKSHDVDTINQQHLPLKNDSKGICPNHNLPMDRLCNNCLYSFCKSCFPKHMETRCINYEGDRLYPESVPPPNLSSDRLALLSLIQHAIIGLENTEVVTALILSSLLMNSDITGMRSDLMEILGVQHTNLIEQIITNKQQVIQELSGLSDSALPQDEEPIEDLLNRSIIDDVADDDLDSRMKTPEPKSPPPKFEYELHCIVNGERMSRHPFNFKDGIITVGKMPGDGRLAIGYTGVSDEHCEIREKNGIFMIKDLKSKNTTWLNGKQLIGDGGKQIIVGDTLKLSSWEFRFVKSGGSTTTPRPEKKSFFTFDSASEDDEKSNEELREERRKAFRKMLDEFALDEDRCPNIKKLIEQLQQSDIYVYQLCYKNRNGQIIVFWTGVTNDPDRRFGNHSSDDTNPEKQKIFQEQDVFMRILYHGTLAECLMLEHLLIHDAETFGDQLCNKDLKEAKLVFDTPVIPALIELLENASRCGIGRTKNERFGKSLSNFDVDYDNCPNLLKLVQEFDEPECTVYCLKYTKKNTKEVIKFYYGVSNEPERRLYDHRGETRKNQDKCDVMFHNKSRVFMKIFIKTTRAIAEVIELLLIQDPTETALTNVGKKCAEKPEIDADILDGAVIELKAMEEANDIFLMATDAKESDSERHLSAKRARVTQHHLNTLTIRRSTALANVKSSATLGFPEENERQILPQLLLFKSIAPYVFITGTGYTSSRFSIVRENEVVGADELVGSFKALTVDMIRQYFFIPKLLPAEAAALSQVEKEKIATKKHQNLVFFARIGLVPNEVKCGKKGCNKQMVLNKASSSAGYQWACYEGRRDTCSTSNVMKNLFVFPKQIPFSHTLLILYLYSRGKTHAEIYQTLGKPGYENVYKGFIESGDGSLNELLTEALTGSAYPTKEAFFADKSLDHLGLLLYWINVKYPQTA